MTSQLQWGRAELRGKGNHPSAPATRTRGFNGAALNCAEKGTAVGSRWYSSLELQWGRAELRGKGSSDSYIAKKIGELQWGRAELRGKGRHASLGWVRPSMLQWGRAELRGKGITAYMPRPQSRPASMGPR